jgi:hypothetical protein
VTRTDALAAALAIGEELLVRLADGEIEDAAIATQLALRGRLLESLSTAVPPTDEERTLARKIVESDVRLVALVDERRRLVASALARVRQRSASAAPGRVLTDLA